jgi:hypothetical protein
MLFEDAVMPSISYVMDFENCLQMSLGTVDLRRSISNLVCCLRGLSVLNISRHATCVFAYKLLDNLKGRSGSSWLSSEDLARLIDYKYTTRCSFWRLLHTDGGYECLCGIAQQCIRKVLLRLEGGVRFGAVVGEAKDAVAGRGKRRVGVAEKADLSGACNCITLALLLLRGSNRRLLTARCRGLGVREEHNAALAFLYKLRERRLGAIVRLDFTTK